MLIGEFYEKAFQLSDETLIQKLVQMTEISFFKKGEIIVRQDETPSKIYFLLDGVFRGFFFDAHGKEITDCFGFEMGYLFCLAWLCPRMEKFYITEKT